MTHSTPDALIDTLVAARNVGDLDTALACYTGDATIVAQPGQVLTGTAGARGALEFFIGLKPEFTVAGRTILVAGDVALHHSQWTLAGIGQDGAVVELSGGSADVFRRVADGGWLIAVDNPWGAGIL